MQGLVTLRPLASSSASKAAGSSCINSRSPASMAMVKTEGTTTGEERARTTTPVSLRRLRLVSKKNNNNMAAAAALFRSSPMLQACAVPAAAARTTTDISAAAEVVVGAAEKKKGNAKIVKSRLQLDTVEDGHCSSSGSEHEPSSVCLAAMVHEFLEQHEGENEICEHSRCNCEAAAGRAACSSDGRSAANDSEDGKSSSLGGGQLLGSLQGLTACTKDSEKILLSEVTEALNAAAVEEMKRGAEQGQENQQQEDQEEAPDSSSSRRRVIMKHLRAAGYNAAICKSRWDHAGGFPGGDYEYIDVVFSAASSGSSSRRKSERVLIDIDFRTQFEIARPTKEYNAIVKALPILFVGGEDRLQQIVNLMSDAVKSSLKKRGMPLPPWRKPEYMLAKWLSSYKRSTNRSSRSGKDQRTSSSEISRIATRDSGWDSKYTKEMQIEYQKPEVRQLSMMKEIQKGAAAAVDDVVYPKTTTNLIINAAAVSSSQAGSSNKSLIEAAPIENMEWELPAVEAKVSRRRPAALTGLAAILKEAGLTAANTQQPKDEGEEQQHQQIMLRTRSLAMAM
ncbi:unnamed protein product [Sphagnum jensenii]|uniref:DUF506 family protein n=1 Tax=Sphagnum jensenii TaxID=128206 RepID=A0ABP1B3J7_9BRYO